MGWLTRTHKSEQVPAPREPTRAPETSIERQRRLNITRSNLVRSIAEENTLENKLISQSQLLTDIMNAAVYGGSMDMESVRGKPMFEALATCISQSMSNRELRIFIKESKRASKELQASFDQLNWAHHLMFQNIVSYNAEVRELRSEGNTNHQLIPVAD